VKFSDGKVLARQSRLHGKFSARLAGIPASRCRGLARLTGLARFAGISARLWNTLKINFAITWKNLSPASWDPGGPSDMQPHYASRFSQWVIAELLCGRRRSTILIGIWICIFMRVNFDDHDVTRPYDGVPCSMLHVKCSKCLNSNSRLHTGEMAKWQT